MNKLKKNPVCLFGIIFPIIVLCYDCESPSETDYTGRRGEIFDIQGNMHKTIGIGKQIWLAENLRSTFYNDSTPIPHSKDAVCFGNPIYSGYCWFNNDSSNAIPYGALYHWTAVSSGKLCPKGWHIPTESDWKTLVNQLGGITYAGGKLKVVGTDYWDLNIGATNSSKFNAVSSGIHRIGGYEEFKLKGYWWSTTETDDSNVFSISLGSYRESVFYSNRSKSVGMSIRCIKDN